MPYRTLGLAAALLAAGVAPGGSNGPAVAVPVVELGLTSPLDDLEEIDEFRRELAERLVWTVREAPDRGEARDVAIRFTAIRIDRGRVTASYRSDARGAGRGLSRVAESIGIDAFLGFRDVCLNVDDPPASVRALSGSSRLDADELERAIADAARTRDFGEAFGLDEPLSIEWGRHVVLLLAASGEASAVRVRPLILVIERL